MPNIFQKIKNNFNNKSNGTSTTTIPNNNNNNESKSPLTKQLSNPINVVIHPNQLSENVRNSNKKKNLNIFSLIIDSSALTEKSVKENSDNGKIDSDFFKTKLSNEQVFNIFDPDEVSDEYETVNQKTFIDDRSFIIDDEDLNSENNFKTSKKLNDMFKDNNCYTINEKAETSSNKSNRISSRASSRSSLGSELIISNLNYLESNDGKIDYLSDKIDKTKFASESYDSEGSGSSSDHAIKNGSKNVLLDALMRKFNVSTFDIDYNDNTNMEKKQNTEFINQENNYFYYSKEKEGSSIYKQTTKYVREDQKRKHSELEKKINKIYSDKQNRSNINNFNNDNNKYNINSNSSEQSNDSIGANDSEIKISPTSETQISTLSNSSLKDAYKSKLKTITVHKLPQDFHCKYMGKTKCKGLWGLKNIRDPVDKLIKIAKQYRSLDELPSVEALISEKGIFIVQKQINIDPGFNLKILKNGLLPINNISYAVQDNIYGKIFSCIVVREKETRVISECYSFLCSKNETARKMALTIMLAFKEYAKLLQTKESNIKKTIKLFNSQNENESDSYA